MAKLCFNAIQPFYFTMFSGVVNGICGNILVKFAYLA